MLLPIGLILLLTQAPSNAISMEVYAAVLNAVAVRPGIERVVVRPVTTTGAGHSDGFDYQNALKGLGALPMGLQRSFEAAHLEQRTIDVAALRTRVPAVPFTPFDAAALLSPGPKEYWEKFYRRFPKSSGVVTFSPVGLSADGESAMVMVDTGCGGKCGDTTYYVLRRQDGKWVIAGRATVRMV